MNVQILASIDPAVLQQGPLFAQFMSRPEGGVPPFLHGVAARDEYWQEIIERSRTARLAIDADARRDMFEALAAYNRRLGASGDILDRLGRAGRDDVFFVVTGQQPGILGGALLVGYKIATAVSLSAYLERRFGIECVPLYWCGSDDADFQEIRTFECPTPALEPVTVTVPADAHTGTQPVGSIEARWTETIWRSVAPLLEHYPSCGTIDRLVAASTAGDADHGDATAALLIALFGGKLAAVDARAGYLKPPLRDLFIDYFDREERVNEIVRARGTALERAGYHAQLEPGPDAGIFLVEKGERRKVPHASRSLLRDALHARIESCSPGVILRTLAQDRLFQPLAAVLGPAEIAYRAQIDELHDLFSIPSPAPVPRCGATWIPRAVAERCAGTGLAWEDLLKTPQALADLLGAAALPRETADESERLAMRLRRELDQYLSSVSNAVTGKPLHKYRTRVTEAGRRLEQAIGQIGEAARQAASDNWPWLPRIDALIRPRGKPQERTVSVLLPFLAGIDEAPDLLTGLAGRFLDDLLDGRPGHYVYSFDS